MLSDEEFLFLWENCEPQNPDFSWDSCDLSTLKNMDEAECKAEFRVEKNYLHSYHCIKQWNPALLDP